MVNEQGKLFNVANKSKEAQMFRVEEYLKDILKACDDGFLKGHSQGMFRPRKKFRHASFGHAWDYLGVDEEHKKIFIERLKELKVASKHPVTIIYSDGSDYDFKLKW